MASIRAMVSSLNELCCSSNRIMCIIVISIVLAIMAIVKSSYYPELTMIDAKTQLTMIDAKIHSLMELALKRAGGQDFYVESGKEDFFISLSIKVIECSPNVFISSLKAYEERNELKGKSFKFGGDHTRSDSREETMNGLVQGGMATGGNVGGNVSGNVASTASVRKNSTNRQVINSKPIPPRAALRHEIGHKESTCKVELSLTINCDINFSNRSLWNRWLSSSEKSNGHVKTISAYYVLSMVNGWNEETKTATIELQYRVETERWEIYSLD